MFIPYEILEKELDHLVMQATLSPSWVADYYWDIYYLILRNSGWTPQAFDEEMLYRIDSYYNLIHDGKVVPIRAGIKNGIF